MQADRSHRGWVAAVTVAVTLTLVLLAVEKHSRESSGALDPEPRTSQYFNSTTEPPGIVLTLGPGTASDSDLPRADRAALNRAEDLGGDGVHAHDIVPLLRTPFEPAPQVVLHAPTPSQADTLPLHSSNADSEYLIEAIAKAFESPMRPVSSIRLLNDDQSAIASDPERTFLERISSLPDPEAISSNLPAPRSLQTELAALKQATIAVGDDATRIAIVHWTQQVEERLGQLISNFGNARSQVDEDLSALASLVTESIALVSQLTDYELAGRTMRCGYGLERRVAVWRAIQACRNQPTERLVNFSSKQLAREQLSELAIKIDGELQSTGDRDDWRRFLMLADLQKWSAAEEVDWEQGHGLAVQVLSRLAWNQLTEQQRTYLNQASYQQLSTYLTPWASQPVDYRRLLIELETMEEDSINRCRASIASVVQTLSVSTQPSQKQVAAAVNEHYRNANVRMAVTAKLLNRLMPSGAWEVRPVRQSILGADTRGDSSYRTRLNVKLIPDPQAWHIDLALEGDMHSSTRASKGPATFHNSSVAQIASQRTLRMDSRGYTIKADGTDVEAQQFLRGFSTNYDSLPIVGDFMRLLVREQFDQQRGIAQRVVRRLIAQETDQEFDKQLDTNFEKAQAELNDRLIGPLQSLNLDPMVVSMSTTEERLSVRYRVAGQSHLGAHTARPRAPSDSWLSMQMHESAINNTIAQVGLEGRTWTLPQLFEKLAAAFKQKQWQVPDDLPRDITIRFADYRPITVQFTDGRVELTLRIAELQQPDRIHLERFIVKTSYVPAADGLNAALVRDDVVSIDGPRLGMRDRLPIRAIFARVFASRSTFPLISEQWQKDPRAQGLAVSQVEVRDGWLGLAISEQNSPHAERTSLAARQLLKTR